MSEVLIQLFVQLIANYTGLRIRTQDQEALCRKLGSRMRSLKLSSPEDYYKLLEGGIDQSNTFSGIAAHGEWRELITLLTTGESYFFRDSGQFWLLENVLLPELIAYQRQVSNSRGNSKPSLRIWSAGCSTGEEPYSLAILVTQLIPDWENWNLFILGTDINHESIAQAKQGLYSPWSFRMVEPERLPQYFQQRKNQWKLEEKYRRLVTFRVGNLARDRFPDLTGELSEIDLIICRNVFVYFESPVIGEISQKFAKTLRSGGYLMTAHAELHGQNLAELTPKVFAQSVVYQRRDNSSVNIPVSPYQGYNLPSSFPLPSSSGIATSRKLDPLKHKVNRHKNPPPLYQSSTSSSDLSLKNSEVSLLLQKAETLFKADRLDESLQTFQHIVKLQPRHFQAYYLIAKIYANLGNYRQAERYCQQAISIDAMSVQPYYIMAHIAEEKGDLDRAKYWLKRILYLAPLSISAYLELAAIYERESDLKRATKMRKTALDILETLPKDYSAEYAEKMTLSELKEYLIKSLGTQD
ncbi:CheR family methyltransferase [Laspinema olomoucense]|uniref:CheR family methyltransferase n=1 Tax=Laspinema olomoucense TaxID=3231600 RepID=UPI0021BB4D73|nr:MULTISPECIES: CheR family methyltransferase [unclassified Laspinema]MCT7974408.1 tetratricopeptide repeat protein [Laspinema sp. D3d]MCT7997257.1 tetratricopeptide repeat protein [Laspinema sp. D3c]